MIITCPNCQTRYQVATETIGSAGRKVQCAHCNEAWQARPQPPAPPRPRVVAGQDVPAPADDRLFGPEDEKGLDAAFVEEERNALAGQRAEALAGAIVDAVEAKGTTKADPGLSRIQQRAISRRRDDLISSLPYAKVRRTARMAGLFTLIAVIAGGIQFRTDIVRQFPDLAGLYSAVGLGVNVIGLEFTDMRTLRSLRDGQSVLVVDAKVVNVASRTTEVPSVVVTLVNQNGTPLYEWSVAPQVRSLAPGEQMGLTTQLANPPLGSEHVRLTFINGRTQSEKAQGTAATQPSAGAPVVETAEHGPMDQPVEPATADHNSPAEAGHAAPADGAHH